jgi:hypothetical protein
MTCLIEKTKRSRVKGSGPRRTEMVRFAEIGKADPDLVDYLNAIADSEKFNDIGTEKYNISGQCDYKDVFNAEAGLDSPYRQKLLQCQKTNENTSDEHDYTEWVGKEISLPMFKKIYRFRISEMDPHFEMDFHIDMDTSVMCRAQICLRDTTSVFEFKTKSGIESLHMEKGKIYFVNVGWMHRVLNTEGLRRVAILGFDYKDYTGNVQLKIQDNASVQSYGYGEATVKEAN